MEISLNQRRENISDRCMNTKVSKVYKNFVKLIVRSGAPTSANNFL